MRPQLKYSVLLFFLAFTNSILCQQRVAPPNFYGENAWMPDSVGNVSGSYFGGKMDSNWVNIAQSNVKLMRYGGNAVDKYAPIPYHYLNMVDSIRAHGMEPIVAVPYYDGQHDSDFASSVVKLLNVTFKRNVKYWIIGNEPDLYAHDTTAQIISAYIQRFSIAMRRVDSTIKIIGPEVSRIKPDNHHDPDQVVVDSLLFGPANIVGMIPSGNGIASGKPYIDYFSWHMYNYDGAATTQTRSWVINRITGTDSARMGYMKRRMDSCNANITGRSAYPIKPIITEAHLCTQGGGGLLSSDSLNGVKCSSFIAGQHWCEIMAIGADKGIEWINFWSAMEGNGMGYMSNSIVPTKKSTYYHMQQMAKWFTDTIFIGTSYAANLKAYASKGSGHIAVMVLNQNAVGTAKRTYTISLDSHTDSLRMNMGINSTLTDSIESSSSTLLLFDCSGAILKKYRYEAGDMSHPFKSVWASSSTDSLITVDAGPDRFNGSCCNNRLIAVTNDRDVSFEWFVVDSTSHFSTNDTVTVNPLNTTTYRVEATKNGCTAVDYITVTIGGETNCEWNCDKEEGGAGDRIANSNLQEKNSVSRLLDNVPNPAQNKTTIYYTLGKESSKAEIRITDLSGAVKQRVPVSAESSSAEIDCSSLEQGIYFYSLHVNDRKVETKKMVVLK
ncbi:MAG: T9SS type A sorting domain-containing protein [Bacteroidia bacterium]